jgi:hypothetical protein
MVKELAVAVGKGILTLAAIACGLGVGALYLLGRDLDESLKPVTEISRYREVRQSFDPEATLIQHFPPEIPREARNVRLYFVPGFLQGAAVLQLRMQLPPDRVQKIQARFRKTAKLKYIPGGKDNNLQPETSPNGVVITHEYRFHTGESSDRPFPKNYELLVTEDTSGAPTYNWKHPNLAGVAIDPATSEVVYWAESG